MGEELHEQPRPFLSPTDLIKNKSVGLMFENITHHSRSIELAEKYAFIQKVKDLSVVMERYTPKAARKELKELYEELNKRIQEIRERKGDTESQRNEEIINLQYQYALEVHEQDIRVLMNSPIIEIDVEGDLDINDISVINTIRGERREDDKTVVLKSQH